MLSISFKLYLFSCDTATFTSLFSADEYGRHIPDTASFTCGWAPVPRPQQPIVYPGKLLHYGETSNTFFKAIGASMSLSFSDAENNLVVNGDATVLTFQVRPSKYEGGAVPAIARGTLDPVPYLGQPKKNYAIKLRDASGQVIGRLLFSLAVSAATSVSICDAASQEALESRQSVDSWGSSTGGSHPPSTPHDCYRPRVAPVAPSGAVIKPSTPPPATSPVYIGDNPISYDKPPTTVPMNREWSAPAPNHLGVPGLEIKLERIYVEPGSINKSTPAPFLLDEEYYVQLIYGLSDTYRTSREVCRNPQEIVYRDQYVRIPEVPSEGDGKLHFSLWERKRQVSGFSVAIATIRLEGDSRRAYAVPFRCHPTRQAAALDISIRRVVLPSSVVPEPQRTASPPAPSLNLSNVSSFFCPPVHGHPTSGTTPVNSQVSPHSGGVEDSRHQRIQRVCQANLHTPIKCPSPLRIHRTNGSSGPTLGSGNTPETFRDNHLCSPPPNGSARNDHEKYLAEVVARIEQQQFRAARPRTALQEDWLTWRDNVSTRNSRASSVVGRRDSLASPMGSICSRENSIGSVLSRRATTPLPTKSFAEQSLQTPYTPVYTPLRVGDRRRRMPSVDRR